MNNKKAATEGEALGSCPDAAMSEAAFTRSSS